MQVGFGSASTYSIGKSWFPRHFKARFMLMLPFSALHVATAIAGVARNFGCCWVGQAIHWSKNLVLVIGLGGGFGFGLWRTYFDRSFLLGEVFTKRDAPIATFLVVLPIAEALKFATQIYIALMLDITNILKARIQTTQFYCWLDCSHNFICYRYATKLE
jgi:hypothetical protein